jgi:hypothetical protein
MSHFAAALGVVLERLETCWTTDGAAWRASRTSLARLLATPAAAPLAPVETTEPVVGTSVTPAPGWRAVTDPGLSKAERLAQLRACPERLPCARCPYGQGEPGHVVFGVGDIDAELMFIGEAPGA